MQLRRSLRWILLALLFSVIPASSFAGVLISVGFAPPVLPVYEQPLCPEPGLMWTPGYWAYGEDGYFWVPGAWVPAPYEGALWTPGYWGWSGGLFVFHEGYWGPHVGYYGGVNYGFGYGGIGFAGGMWHGGVFAYNTAVVHVGAGFHDVYVDRVAVDRGFVARDSHVAFSGGPGGINHPPSPEERIADRDQHIARTSFQSQHESSARSDRTAYATHNGGHPQNPAASRPLPAETHAAPGAAGRVGAVNYNSSKSNSGNVTARPSGQGPGSAGAESRTYNASHSNTAKTSEESSRYRPGNNKTTAAPEASPSQASHSTSTPKSESHPASKPKSKPEPKEKNAR